VTTWTVRLTKDSKGDFRKLDGREKAIVAKRLISLERDPGIGNPLGNKMGMDLAGYFKLYADGKRLRIVYAFEGKIIKVIAIGKREEMEVYRLAMKRIEQMRE